MSNLAEVVKPLLSSSYLNLLVRQMEEALVDSSDPPQQKQLQDLVLNQLRKPGLLQCVHVVDFIWEQLNTGHWKSVSVAWRQLYYVTRLWQVLLLATTTESDHNHDFVCDLIRLCDLALLMGAPLNRDQNVAAKLASMLVQHLGREGSQAEAKIDSGEGDGQIKRQRLTTSSCVSTCRRANPELKKPCRCFKFSNSVMPLDRHQELSLESFITDYRHSKRPVVIEGALVDWPAFTLSTQWSMEYFIKVAGPRLVPVEIGKRYTDSDWTQTLMTLEEFISKYVYNKNKKEVGYLAQYPLFDQIEELSRDIDTLPYCFTQEEENEDKNNKEDDEIDINIWLGPSDTVSPLHTDPKHNLLCQVFGYKYIRLYNEYETPFLYAHEETMLSNSSRINLDSITEQEVKKHFPKFEKASGFETVLKPGDALYIPPKCWHFVQALTESCSVSFWFK